MAVNAEFTPFISSTGPLASLMRVYQWQLWRPESLEASTMVVIDPNNVTKVQPDDAVKAVLQVANTQASTLQVPPQSSCVITTQKLLRHALTRP